ncbi:MrcB family domain-containing protein [Paraliobacillus sediminis]|uniref:MrcB family domain-containing protein n=1 Tax=Paraliobacillus sediminis TaxID=1885916 RepID=UPI000E3CE0C8|nr:DUF3578 domain-containing protein [Paraliobacillus sediminis]
MQNLFKKVLNGYEEFYQNGKSKPSSHPIGITTVYELPKAIQTSLNLNDNKYKVQGSYGSGILTFTPWIAIFDRSITESAEKGFYVVLLFRKDMSGYYLSLNQGTKYLTKKFNNNNPKEKMRNVASYLRDNLNLPLNEFNAFNIKSLGSSAGNYEAANICAKFYPSSSLPDDKSFNGDITILLEALENIRTFMGNRSLDNVVDEIIYDEVIEDTKFQEDISIAKASKTPEEPQKRPDSKSDTNVSLYLRNPEKAKEAIEKSGYQCEFNKTHLTFKSKRTNKNFVEAHHLIPMGVQGQFEYSLDVPGNIVALCPNCHRRIHFGIKDDKKEMLSLFLKKNEIKLKKFGIEIDESKLIKIYNV